jgi:ribose transport system substrate-binding protein
MTGIGRAIRRSAVLVTAVAALAACSSSGSSSSSTSSPSSGGGGAPASATLQAAQTATNAEYVGTSSNVDPTPRPAVKNKSVIIISAAQETKSSEIPALGAQEAAQALGWKAQIYDAKLNPSNYAPLVRQAIAAHPDAIVLVAVDCAAAEQPLQEAKAAGIAITPVYAFDCSDAHAGGAKQSLFSVITSYGPEHPNIDAFTESYGADQANYIIAKSHNTAKIIALQDNEFTVLYWTLQGFQNQINASKGSKVVDTVSFTAADLINGNAKAAIQAAVLNHPEATWIKSPYS